MAHAVLARSTCEILGFFFGGSDAMAAPNASEAVRFDMLVGLVRYAIATNRPLKQTHTHMIIIYIYIYIY